MFNFNYLIAIQIDRAFFLLKLFALLIENS